MKRFAITVFALVCGISARPSFPADVTLRWDYPHEGAAGFTLYCGGRSRGYSTRADVGYTDIYTLDLSPGVVEFCAVAAYDSVGWESEPSNEIAVYVREDTQTVELLPPFSVREQGWISPTPTGVQVGFSLPIDAKWLNLYWTEQEPVKVADVTLVGVKSGAVLGSLVVSGDRRGFTFVKWGGLLAPDTYTLTIASRPDSVLDDYGRMLDGDGRTGQDYSVAFLIPSSDLPILSVGEFARGPGQAINLPASDPSAGIPVQIAKGASVHEVSFGLRYDPNLLSVQAVTLDGAVTGTLKLVTIDPLAGLVRVLITDLTGLSDTSTVLLRIHAAVPVTAPYRSQHVLDLHDLAFNGGTLGGLDDDGLHVVAKVGDVSGEGRYTSFDSYLVQRVGARLDNGFSAFPLTEPRIVGDVNGNGKLESNDAYLIQLKAARLPVPQIPD